ncbi:MAG: hypothetical protein ACI90V_006320 [Bacillariaceae sp.]|jgi:hypothetical protein
MITVGCWFSKFTISPSSSLLLLTLSLNAIDFNTSHASRICIGHHLSSTQQLQPVENIRFNKGFNVAAREYTVNVGPLSPVGSICFIALPFALYGIKATIDR